jgi:hypothetical protein
MMVAHNVTSQRAFLTFPFKGKDGMGMGVLQSNVATLQDLTPLFVIP